MDFKLSDIRKGNYLRTRVGFSEVKVWDMYPVSDSITVEEYDSGEYKESKKYAPSDFLGLTIDYDILERLGFKQDVNNPKIWEKREFRIFRPNNTLSPKGVIIMHNFHLSTNSKYDLSDLNYSKEMEKLIKVSKVHELQNLWNSVYGEELTFMS